MVKMEGFTHVPGVKTGAVIELGEKFSHDPNNSKISLNAGAYRDADGRPYLLPSIKRAALELVQSPSYSHEYLTLDGLPAFLAGARAVAFGEDVDPSRIASFQTVGGTGACHMGAAFLKKWYDVDSTAYISDPSWENHHDVFHHEGIETALYPYWDEQSRTVHTGRMVKTLASAPARSIVVLHACGHNPTGQDLSESEWKHLAKVMKERSHFAFFDSAYQGFVSGELQVDNAPVKLFASMGIPLLVAQSFSKNAGLYGERLGVLHIMCANSESSSKVVQQLKYINRREISSACRYGAEVMAHVFSDKALYKMWEQDLKEIAGRLSAMRIALVKHLAHSQVPGDWSHITSQRGMFAYTGLSSEQCAMLVERYHIYVPPSGRISVAGLNEHNVENIAKAFAQVVHIKSAL